MRQCSYAHMTFAKITLSPTGCLIAGMLMLCLGVFEVFIAAFQPHCLLRRIWFRPRWGVHGDAGPASRIGVAAWGFCYGTFGATFILNGFFGVLPDSWVLPIVFGAIGLVIAAAIYDRWFRKSKREVPGLNRKC